VVITGSGFTGASSVKFGASSASFTVNSYTQITATTPAGSAGAADVTVTTVGGTSATTAADRFTWTAAPTVGGMSPSTDTSSGGILVMIGGSHLSPVTSVMFGSASAAFIVLSDSSIIATAPAQSAGTVTVSVTSPGGSATVGTFTYTAASTKTWVGGSSGNWNVPANWSSGTIPGSDDVVIPSGDTVTFSAGTATVHQVNGTGSLVVTGGTLNVQAACGLANLTVSGGALNCNSSVTVNNALSWTGGILGGHSLTIASGATATLADSGMGLTLSGLTVNNQGTTNWTNSGTLTLSSAEWNNASGAVVSAQPGSGAQQLAGSGGTINNSGTFSKTGSGTTTISGAAFNNSGTLSTQAGTLVLSGLTIGGSLTVSSGATLKLSGATLSTSASVSGAGSVEVSSTSTLGGTISASGGVTIDSGATATAVGGTTINSNLSNNGTLILGASGTGIVTLGGNYAQGSSAVLGVQIIGSTAGSLYGQLRISGSASLAGVLNIGFIGGYSPPSGTTFRLLTFGSASGSFSTINSGGTSVTPQYDSADFSVLAMADPHPNSVEGDQPEEEPATAGDIGESIVPCRRDEVEENGAMDSVFVVWEAAGEASDLLGVALEEGMLLPVAFVEALLGVLL
jgi:hypothetical protein